MAGSTAIRMVSDGKTLHSCDHLMDLRCFPVFIYIKAVKKHSSRNSVPVESNRDRSYRDHIHSPHFKLSAVISTTWLGNRAKFWVRKATLQGAIWILMSSWSTPNQYFSGLISSWLASTDIVIFSYIIRSARHTSRHCSSRGSYLLQQTAER